MFCDEKFIPKIINSLLNNQKVPVYSDGMNIREWIFVDDHNDALLKIINIKLVRTNII